MTTALPAKKTLEELLVRFDLEPSIADIYVEGPSDHDVLRWYLQTKGLTHIGVYTADSVDIPPSDFSRLGQDANSNRSWVVVLALLLEEECAGRTLRVACVADRDFDDYLQCLRTGRFLRYTDYTSLEMYYFNVSFLAKFLSFVVRADPERAESVRRCMAKVLRRCYVMRLSNESLRWRMAWVDCGRHLRWAGVCPTLDDDGFVRHYLSRNGRTAELATFRATMKKFESRLNADPRMHSRGHDFTDLLFRLNGHRGTSAVFSDIRSMERALLGYLETAYLDNESLLKELVSL
jgi:hypothetical protein